MGGERDECVVLLTVVLLFFFMKAYLERRKRGMSYVRLFSFRHYDKFHSDVFLITLLLS